MKSVPAANLSSNFRIICFPEVQECGEGRVPHRHVHLGLAGLPQQPGRLRPAAHGGVPAGGQAALSIRSETHICCKKKRRKKIHRASKGSPGSKHLDKFHKLLYLFTPDKNTVAQHPHSWWLVMGRQRFATPGGKTVSRHGDNLPSLLTFWDLR